ncbi:MAG: ABC-F family ATP-binding cassette domain-containing protein [Streptococcus sp.]|nr:ABC-F family ATP-binding cassette domain-containing protein [Streptococcus sp.]
MILLQGQGLARTFADEVLFENITIHIQENSRIAIVGRNGTGKSTLLKMLAGIEEPSLGAVSKKKDLSIGYLDQYAAIQSSRTVWEEMVHLFEDVETLKKQAQKAAEQLGDPDLLSDPVAYELALKRYDQLQEELNQKNAYGYESEIRTVLHGFRFYPEDYDQPIQALSGGQRTRLALARILLEKHDLLILDEPTNHLDIETLTWLEDYLRSSSSALVIVSHDQYFLDRVCNEVYEISHKACEYYKGNYSHYLEEREQRYLLKQKAYEKQQQEIHDLEEFIAKNLVRASTTKRAQSRRKKLEKMERLEKPKGDQRSARFEFTVERESGNQVLQVTDAYIGYDHEAFSGPISFQLRKREAIAIVGPNGIGKSTLLKSITGELPLIEGSIDLGAGVQVGYYDQNLAGLSSNQTVLEELWSRHSTMPEKDVRSILGSFLFSGNDVEKTTAQLSGGEKARLALCKLSLEHDNFLLLDEPTNHLDIDSKEVLEDALIDYDGTICFVSHDRFFINKVATAILEIEETGSTLYLGDYDYYLEKKQEKEELAALQEAKDAPLATAQPMTEAKASYHASKEEQRQIRTLTRRIEQLETEMHDIETALEQVHEAMTLEENYSDPDKSAALSTEEGALLERQETLLEEWEEASLALEEFNL